MLLFVKRYVAALLTLLIAMCGYSLFVEPAIEPTRRQPAQLPNFSGALGGQQWWISLFPTDSWQADNPQILQSKRGVVLLSQSWVQEGPKTLRLKPLTMILPQVSMSEAESDAHDVLIINAELGAVIHFEDELDPSVAIPSVERGQLSGLIEVTRQVQGKPHEHPWSLRTSNLSLDRSRVFTQESVIIEWPDGIIEGHDMKLTLQGELLGSGVQDTSAWGPLRTLELYHLDRLDMRLADGGLWAQSKLTTPPGTPELSSLPARLQVACGGRFTFDFTQSRATLVNGVQLVHQLGQLPADEFSSHEVLVQIAPPNKTAAPLPAHSPLGGIQVREIEATGIDSLENFVGERKVEIRAPTIGAFASAKRLRINVLENRIELDGKLNHAGATQSAAWLKYMGYEFTAPRIDYDADGSGNNPALNTEHLGFLIATGAGELRMPAESSTGQALVRWQDSLEMRPTEIPGQQWVGLFGNVLVESALHGYMASDDLEIWLRKNSAQLTPSPVAKASAAEPQFLPERLRATGQIALSTQQIKAQVGELSLALNFAAVPNPDRAASQSLPLSDSAGRPMHQWVSPPAAANAAPTAGQPAPPPNAPPTYPAPASPIANMNPMNVVGRALNATVIVAGRESWLDNLTVVGPLRVSGQTSQPNLPDWNVDGDELQMATNPAGQIDMQITGQPARISLAEGSLEGPIIRFDQRSNLIWMDQPGEFTIPTSALQSPQGTTTAEVKWFKPPHCQWQGRMLFDGKLVRIEGNIRFDGALAVDQNQFWWINGQSEVLQLELSEAVDLDNLKTHTAEPLRITVSQNVNILASQLDQLGTKISREQLRLPSLTYDIKSNEILGLGPGSIRSWHIAKTAIGQMASSQSSRPSPNLQGAHLVFRDSMRGFLNRSELYFQGKVELAAGPLASWEGAIDVAQMQRLELNQLHLDCDLLKVYDTSGLSSTPSFASGSGRDSKAWEFQAKGNVNFAGKAESGDYEGSGSEVTYVQAKELLTLWGEPRRPGRIIVTPANHNQQGVINASVEQAAINPRTLAIESYKVGADGIRVELPNASSNPLTAPAMQAPLGPAPNPRGTVSEFFQRK